MGAREVLRRALNAAIEWEKSLEECYPRDDPEAVNCREMIARYRHLLEKHFGTKQTPLEQLFDDQSPTIPVMDIVKATRD